LNFSQSLVRPERIELHPRQGSPQAALRNRNSSFVLDGEAVLLGVDGRSDFDALHSRRHDAEVEFYAFDILVSDGEDLGGLPLSMRKASLSRLLARRLDGIFLSDFEQGEIGPDLFRRACLMGLEGMVSKHRESLYRGGRFRHWVKIKNRRIRRSAGCRISSETAPARAMRRFEVPEDNGFIAECVRLLGLDKRHHADRVPAGTHRGDGDHIRSRASLTVEDIRHASWDDAEEKDKP
jgi:hypothetical protein